MNSTQSNDSDNNQKSGGGLKGCLIVFLVFVVLVIIGTLGAKIIDHIPREIAIQENGIYTVVLQATSSPVFPFGPQDGRIVLKENSKEISKIDFELSNDGKSMDKSNWKVEWASDKVAVTIMGEEQNDEKFILYYNGEIENANADLHE